MDTSRIASRIANSPSLAVSGGDLMHGYVEWRVKGTLSDGTVVDSVLMEGDPGNFFWETSCDSTGEVNLPIPDVVIPSAKFDEVLAAIDAFSKTA